MTAFCLYVVRMLFVSCLYVVCMLFESCLYFVGIVFVYCLYVVCTVSVFCDIRFVCVPYFRCCLCILYMFLLGHVCLYFV